MCSDDADSRVAVEWPDARESHNSFVEFACIEQLIIKRHVYVWKSASISNEEFCNEQNEEQHNGERMINFPLIW